MNGRAACRQLQTSDDKLSLKVRRLKREIAKKQAAAVGLIRHPGEGSAAQFELGQARSAEAG